MDISLDEEESSLVIGSTGFPVGQLEALGDKELRPRNRPEKHMMPSKNRQKSSFPLSMQGWLLSTTDSFELLGSYAGIA